MNPFTATMKLRELENKINQMIASENRMIKMCENNMALATLGTAPVSKESQREYHKFWNLHKTLHQIFLNDLKTLVDEKRTA